jgi:serine recombinase
MQLDALRRAGVEEENLWWEQRSAVSRRRPRLELALAQCVRGDTFVVWKLDRFGRRLRDLIDMLADLEKRGIAFRSITDGIDTTTPIGRFGFHMLGAAAQLERDLVVERTRHGMAYARRKGSQIGALPKLTKKQEAKALEMLKAGKRASEVARHFGVVRQTILNRPHLKKVSDRWIEKRRKAKQH